METERKWASLPMPDWLHLAWKGYAKSVNKEQRVILSEFVTEYITQKQSYKEGQYVVFYAPIVGAKPRSVELDSEIYRMAEVFAKHYKTRFNRVVTSALIDGLVKHKVFKI